MLTKQPARPYIGGQAVIEGVMMRSPGSLSIVCRRRSGELIVRERAVPHALVGWRALPLVRGVLTVVESVRMGSQALRWSADVYERDLAEAEAGGAPPAAPPGPLALSALALGVVALATSEPDDGARAPGPQKSAPAATEETSGGKGGALAWLPLLFAVALFVAAPQAAAEGVNRVLSLGYEVTSPGFQAITGAMKLTIVVGYLLAIRQIGEVRRVFQYHGAEHKSISTYEAGHELRVEHARKMTTAHPRCGTTFLVMVAFVSIVVFTVAGSFLPHVPGGRLAESVGFFFMKLPFLPVIAAVTYEIQRIFARYCTVGPLRAVLWPGFLVQKITTAEPDDAQLEVALASLQATLWREHASEAPSPGDRVFADYGTLLSDPGYARV